MYEIKKMRADSVIDFAAEELKKYLRMMMPESGDVSIVYEPMAECGFRLGLAEDFGLSFEEVQDPVLDDVVHIETDTQGGILAGSNPRSVLFAVYRYLKEQGCRWLFAGVDGEYIPVQDIRPVRYHHLPSFRFRGHCNEGAENQQCMLDAIDFYAKQEMNVFMLEFDTPFTYYDRYYLHTFNQKNRKPEPVTPQQVKQWKRQCETEIAKRGLQFHDMGHGWTAEPFGLNSVRGWTPQKVEITEDIRKHLALVNGKREIWRDVAMATNLCMSQPETQMIFAKAVADYAQKHQNVTYLHIALADALRNHCECEECRKLPPSDYYVRILNQIDALLTERGLATRIVFSIYHDTAFAPLQERIKIPERFALLYAPIQRSYTSSIQRKTIGAPNAYLRNAWKDPLTVEENAAHLLAWQEIWPGCCFCYEYHYWIHMFRDPGLMSISRRIYEDILALDEVGLEGFLEDGTQRPFFPNGFATYIYAEALLDKHCDYEAVKEDYFRHAYGDDWIEVAACLEQISEQFDFAFMEGEKSVDPGKGNFYNPAHAEDLKKVYEIAERERKLAEEHAVMPHRVQTVSMHLLLRHAEYCEKLAEIMIAKTTGHQGKANELLDAFSEEFGRYEVELERYYDHFMVMKNMKTYMTEEFALN